jgi:predicted DsbA family dithiol-disulfide isomerase
MEALKIDIYSDIVCPWCLIGAKRLEDAVASMRDEVEARVVYHPFFLDPSTPPEGRNVQEELRRKYGADPRTLFARVESAAQESGIPLDLTKQPFSYPTAMGHTLIRHAKDKGTQPAMAKALHEAYFLLGQNIASKAVLAEIASRHGFTEDEATRLIEDEQELAITRSEAELAAAKGIRGVPFFVFDDRLAVSGAQSVAVLQQAMREAVKTKSV